MKDILKDKLEILNNDSLMIEALREVLDKRIEKDKPQISQTDNNSVLGEKYRAYEQAKQMLEGFFDDIGGFKNISDNNNQFNKGK